MRNNSGNTFTITGTDGNGDAQTEDLTGPGASATVNSANKYLTITSIVSDGAIVTDIQAGILGTGDTYWNCIRRKNENQRINRYK